MTSGSDPSVPAGQARTPPASPGAGSASPGASAGRPHAGSSGRDVPTPAEEPQDREVPSSVSRGATTRAAAAWFATAAALVVLVLLIILILQNQEPVEVRYLGFAGSLPLGTALLIAAVAGAAVVTIVGVVRLTQLRINARRVRRLEAASRTEP